jgi:hypothetical protein
VVDEFEGYPVAAPEKTKKRQIYLKIERTGSFRANDRQC